MPHSNAQFLSLQETAALHDISSSHLSRCVRDGRPAKGVDLAPYAQFGRNGRIVGFRFPPDYPLLANAERNAAGGSPSDSPDPTTDQEGSHPSAAPEGDRTPVSGEMRIPGVMEGGYARTSGQLHAGATVWGRLQRKDASGDWTYLETIMPETDVSIDEIADGYGAGRYRISRMEEGEQVHVEFGIDRQAPGEVERRLASVYQLEDEIEAQRVERAVLEEQVEHLQSQLEALHQALLVEKQKRSDAEIQAERVQVEHEIKVEQLQYDQERSLRAAQDDTDRERRELKRKHADDLAALRAKHRDEQDTMRLEQRKLEQEIHRMLLADAPTPKGWERAAEAFADLLQDPDVLGAMFNRTGQASNGNEDEAPYEEASGREMDDSSPET